MYRHQICCLLLLSSSSCAADNGPYLANRTVLAANIAARYNKTMQLLAGAHAGGNGFQWNGFSIIDENYFSVRLCRNMLILSCAQTMPSSIVSVRFFPSSYILMRVCNAIY